MKLFQYHMVIQKNLLVEALGRLCPLGITAKRLVVGVDVARAARIRILLRIAAEDGGAQACDIQT